MREMQLAPCLLLNPLLRNEGDGCVQVVATEAQSPLALPELVP